MKLKYNQFAKPRSFRGSKVFESYADEQAKYFGALNRTNQNAFQWWGNTLENHWKGAATAAQNSPDDLGAVQDHLNQYPVFPYDGALTRLLLEMTERGRAESAKQITSFLKGALENKSAQSYRVGQLLAQSEFRLAVELENQSSTIRKPNIDDLVKDHEERLEVVLKVDKKELEEKRSNFEAFQSEAAATQERAETQFSEFITKASSDWHAAYSSYVDQLATDTAVELWRKRSEKHEERYKTFRTWVIGFGLVGLALAIAWIFGGFALARHVFQDDKTAQLAAYTAGSIALFTLLVWGLRVLIRSMMSEDHLSTDASARSALAHTYLALTKEEAATEKDRAIILASLFAPISDGLVKDDGMPAFSPASIAAQAITKP